jgi:hypothetical protein
MTIRANGGPKTVTLRTSDPVESKKDYSKKTEAVRVQIDAGQEPKVKLYAAIWQDGKLTVTGPHKNFKAANDSANALVKKALGGYQPQTGLSGMGISVGVVIPEVAKELTSGNVTSHRALELTDLDVRNPPKNPKPKPAPPARPWVPTGC